MKYFLQNSFNKNFVCNIYVMVRHNLKNLILLKNQICYEKILKKADFHFEISAVYDETAASNMFFNFSCNENFDKFECIVVLKLTLP